MDYGTKLSVLGSIAHSLYSVYDSDKLPDYDEVFKRTLEYRKEQPNVFEPDLLKAWVQLKNEVLEEKK
jgi:hypothetical protein